MTRAKTELCMTWRREVPIFTKLGMKRVSKNRSRFLDPLVSKAGKKASKSSKMSSSATGSRRSGTVDVYSNRQNGSGNRRMNSFPTRTTRSFSTAKPQAPPVPSQSTPKFEGTTNILGKQRKLLPLHLASPTTSSRPQRPIQSTSASNGQRRVPRQVPLRMASTQNSTPRAQSKPARRVTASIDASPPKTNKDKHQFKPQPDQSCASKNNNKKQTKSAMDSTWFFPVGSEVMHKDIGRGIVLNPPAREEQQDLVVRVQFENGDKKEFPLDGTELSPIVL